MHFSDTEDENSVVEFAVAKESDYSSVAQRACSSGLGVLEGLGIVLAFSSILEYIRSSAARYN